MSSKSSKTDPPRSLPETVVVATVRRPHGLKGEVLVDLQSDVPGRLAPGDHVEVVSSNGERSAAQVRERRQHSRGTLIRLEGVDDRIQADLLRGARFEVQRHETPPAPDGSYYYFEKHVPQPVGGMLTLSDRPGFGIELDESKIAEIRQVHWNRT